jgi:hypothetical protein
LHDTEWPLFVLDALPVFSAVILWAFVWPPTIMDNYRRILDAGVADIEVMVIGERSPGV